MTETAIDSTSSASRYNVQRVLLVIDQPCTSPELCTDIRAFGRDRATEAFVTAPTHSSAAAKWYIDEDVARADATCRLRACLACLTRDGIDADGHLGDPDPVQAITDALEVFPADAILVVTAPERTSRRLRKTAVDRAQHSFRQPIEHVEMPLCRSG